VWAAFVFPDLVRAFAHGVLATVLLEKLVVDALGLSGQECVGRVGHGMSPPFCRASACARNRDRQVVAHIVVAFHPSTLELGFEDVPRRVYRSLALAKETKSNRVIIAVGFILMAIVFATFEISVYHSQPLSLALTVCLVAAAVLIEIVLTRSSRSSRPA